MTDCEDCSSETVCTKCSDNYLHPTDTNCSTTCPTGFSPNSVDHICDECNETFFPKCSVCSNITCLGCSDGEYLTADNSSCVVNCTVDEES